MKQLILGCVLFALSGPVWAAVDPSERYLDVYFLILEGEEAEAAGHWPVAHAKFSAALKILDQIKADAPDWHTGLVEFRTKHCRQRLEEIEPKLPAPVAPPPPAEPPARATELDDVEQLRAELQKARDEVRRLTELRDRLSEQLAGRLQEPAPRDRETAQQTLAELRALQATNEAIAAELKLARERAARADRAETELRESQQRIATLETERTGLNEKLRDALTRLSLTETSPEVEELIRKNASLVAELASAQAEITRLRDEMAGAGDASAAEAVQLRADVGQLRSELERMKVLLAQRTEELEQARADSARLSRANEDLMGRLNETDRQLRAARASTDKDNEIIEQLRKENALLREIAGQQEAQAKAAPPARARGGFLWFKPKAPPAQPASGQEDTTVAHSEAGKLVAAVKSPGRGEAELETRAAPAASESPIVRRLLADARAAMAQDDWPTAAERLESALQQEPDNVTALTNLGVLHYQQGQIERAEELLRRASTLAPNDSQSRAVLGILYFRKGRIDDAYRELTRAVALNPRNAEAHNYLGIVMSEKGWASAAEQEVRRALELDPQYADAHFNLALIYSRQRTPRTELARYHYQRARELGSAADAQLELALGLPATH